MTVPRGPTRRPTAGDPWAGARKSRVRPRVHSECDESERTARLWERPALPRRRGCGACGVCGARRVLWGAQQGRESRGCRGSQDQAETGRPSAPPRASGRGRRPSPAVGLWRQGRCLRPTAWGQARPPCPRSLSSVKAQDAQRVPPTAPQRSILALACPRLSRPFPGWQLGRQRWGGPAQSTKCQTPSGGNHPSARPHCVTRGSRGAAGPKAQGAWAGPLWAAPSWRASSPVLSPGESAWTSVAICLGLSPARGDLAAELCWGWGEAE